MQCLSEYDTPERKNAVRQEVLASKIAYLKEAGKLPNDFK